MKNEAYEKAYCDAREALYNRGKRVSTPQVGPDSIRYCVVEGSALGDHSVLKEAWDNSLADEILLELAKSESLPDCCPEGTLLWLQYANTTRRNLEILIAQQLATQKLDLTAFAELAPVLSWATEFRRQTRRSQLDHAASHYRSLSG
jgi:hypothetical protein